MKKKLLIIGGVIVALIAGAALFLTNGLSEMARLPIEGIDLSHTADGSYTGVYEFKRWSNTLVVQVEGHQITGISIEKDFLVQPGVSDDIFRRVIERQDTKVDAVAGATVSSKAYLKAIENALD